MGMCFAPLYAYLLKRENEKKAEYLRVQAALPDNEKRVYTVEELRDLGDR